MTAKASGVPASRADSDDSMLVTISVSGGDFVKDLVEETVSHPERNTDGST